MIFTSVFEARQRIESPNVPLTEAALLSAFQGQPTHAGVTVDEVVAMNYSAWWAGVNIISKTIGRIPLVVYERLDRGRQRARDLAEYHTLKTRPNPEITARTFWQVIAAHALSWGNAYAEVERSGAGRMLALWPLLPDRTRVVREKGIKWCVTRLEPGVELPAGYRVRFGEVWIPPGAFIHFPGLSFDGLMGYSPPRSGARDTIAGGLATTEHANRFFGQGLTPSFLLRHPETLSTEAQQRLAVQVADQVGGLSKAHKMLVLEEGMEVEKLGVEPEKAQLLQSREFVIGEVARILDLPLHMLQIYTAGQGYNTVEAKRLDYVGQTVSPWLVLFEQVITWEVVPGRGVGAFYAEFNIDALLRGDVKTRADFYQKGRQNGWLSPNDVRELENLNPITGGGGDDYHVQVNMVSLADLSTMASDDAPPGGEDGRQLHRFQRFVTKRSGRARQRLQKAQLHVFQRAAEHFTMREVRRVESIVKRALAATSATPIADLLAELRAWYDTFPHMIQRELVPVLASFGQLLAEEIATELSTELAAADVDMLAAEYADTYAFRHIDSSLAQLQAVISQVGGDAELDAVRDALLTRLEQWEDTRAEKIARRESVRFGGHMARQLYGLAGVAVLVWSAIGKSCPICNELDGRTVGISVPFVQAGETVDPQAEGTAPLENKGGPKFHPPIHDGCDCVVGPG